MKNRILIIVLVLVCLTDLNSQTQNINTALIHNFNNCYFIRNQGQFNDSIKFYSIQNGFNSWLTDDGVYLDYYKVENGKKTGIVLKMKIDKQELVNYQALNKIETYLNYFLGSKKKNWETNIPLYQQVMQSQESNSDYKIKYYFENGSFRFDINLNKNADPNKIRIRFEGADKIYINKSSELVLETVLGDIILRDLKAYQLNDQDNLINVPCTYKILENGMTKSVSFDAKNFDKKRELIIDPIFYATFLGGEGWDSSEDIAVDRQGSSYIVGYTNSKNFPATLGAYSEELNSNNDTYPDIFVSKFDSTGKKLIFSTFIGGVLDDFGKSIALDDSLNIYITGYTGPTATFPVTEGAFDTTNNGAYDAFIVKLDKTGSQLKYSTLIGSSNDDFGRAIAVDDTGTVYVTGYTMSNVDFPVTPDAIQAYHKGGNDIFFCKLNNKGDSLLTSTYIGGSLDDFAENIYLDKQYYVYIAGSTRSLDFPVTSDAYEMSYQDTTTDESGSDALLLKIHRSGLYLSYATYLGGSGRDIAYGVSLDNDGNYYLTGMTESKDFPVTAYAYDTTYRSKQGERTAGDIFVSKLSNNGKNLSYSTYIGGSSADKAYDISVDSYKNAIIIGATGSFDLPVSKNAFDKTYNDSSFGSDCLIAALDSTGNKLIYSSFYGGINHDIAYALNLVNDSLIYFTGVSSSRDFPVSPDAYSSTYSNNTESDAFYTILQPNFLSYDAGGDKSGNLQICKGELIQLGGELIGAKGNVTYEWIPASGLNNSSIAHPYLTIFDTADYIVHVTDSKGYEDWDTIHIEILPFIQAKIYGPDPVFINSVHTYGTIKNDFAKYIWEVTGGTIISNDSSNTVSVKWKNGPTGYLTLIVINDKGCPDTLKNFEIEIGEEFKPKLIPLGQTTFCKGGYCILDAGEGYTEYLWSDGIEIRYNLVKIGGQYWVTVKDSNGYTAVSDTINIIVNESPEKPIIIYDTQTKLLSCNVKIDYYQWYLNGAKIPDATNQTYFPDRIGWYKCEIGWKNNSCTTFSDSLEMKFGNVLEDIKNNIKVSIYPNPTYDLINFDLSCPDIYTFRIDIYDLYGKQVNSEQMDNLSGDYHSQLQMNNVVNGVYFISVKINDVLLYDKIIKID